MSFPLSPLSDSGQNLRGPASVPRNTTSKPLMENNTLNGTENFYDAQDDLPPSSPFMAEVDNTLRSPGRSKSPGKNAVPQRAVQEARLHQLTESTLRENEGLTPGIKIMEDDTRTGPLSTPTTGKAFDPDSSCFSSFSAVPNADVTTFAPLEHSPSKRSPSKARGRNGARGPSHSRSNTPGTAQPLDVDYSHGASPTPKQHRQLDFGDDTTQLLEFTETLNLNRSPTRHSQPVPHGQHGSSDFLSSAAGQRLRSPIRNPFQPGTPSGAHQLANLLDFDLPPAPTPRSVPSVTPRELDALKASFFSQISSLKAAISGKEAEIHSLKGAKDDAERRIGDVLEQARQDADTREQLLAEQADWEKRDTEMQSVLRSVKEQILDGERERQELALANEEAERRRKEGEARTIELESQIAGLQASTLLSTTSASGEMSTPGSGTSKAVEMAVEKVARELHALYKAKHETKVGALKKSYEARWEKRIKELQAKVDQLTDDNEKLRLGRDATMTAAVPSILAAGGQTLNPADSPDHAVEQAATAAATAKIDALQVSLLALNHDLDLVKSDNTRLHAELDLSRQENSDLVAAVEQMLLLENNPTTNGSTNGTAPAVTEQPTAGDGLPRPRLPKASGLRGPGFGSGPPPSESRIGGGGGGGGSMGLLKRSVSGSTGRSGMMSNIERMGRGRVGE